MISKERVLGGARKVSVLLLPWSWKALFVPVIAFTGLQPEHHLVLCIADSVALSAGCACGTGSMIMMFFPGVDRPVVREAWAEIGNVHSASFG